MEGLSRLATVALIPALILLGSSAARAADPPGQRGAKSQAKDDSVVIQGWLQERHQGKNVPRSSKRSTVSHQRLCTTFTPAGTGTNRMAAQQAHRSACTAGEGFCALDSGPGRIAAWRVTRTSSGPDGWTNTGEIDCLRPAQGAAAVTVSSAQFRRLPIPAPKIITQPATQVVLVNLGANLLTTKRTETLTTTVLGQPVQVRATPTTYHWTYGDGHQLTTTDPGGRYPTMPTLHNYQRPGRFTVTLRTTFTGEYSVAGGPWQPISGTAVTQSAPVTITAEERRAVLTS